MVPSSRYDLLDDATFVISWRMRAGLPVIRGPQTCSMHYSGEADARCGEVLDEMGIHSTSCGVGRARTQRHEGIAHVLAGWMTDA